MLKSSNVVTRTIANTTVLVSLKFTDGLFAYHLDDVSAFLWHALDHNKDIESLATKLCEAFEVTKEQALKDVEHYVNDLKEAGLIL